MPSLAVKCGATLALLAALGTLFTLQSQRYLGDRMPVGAVGGVATTGLAFMTMGVEHAAVWGVLAFLLDFIPCLGSIAFGWLWALRGSCRACRCC